MAYSNKPKKIGKVIDDFVESYPYKKELKRGMILSRFPIVVGKLMAGQVQEMYFKGGKLIVHVSNPGWRHELHSQRYRIRKKLNESVKDDVVEEIRVLS